MARPGTGTDPLRVQFSGRLCSFSFEVLHFTFGFRPFRFVHAPVLAGWTPVDARVSIELARHRIPGAVRGQGYKLPPLIGAHGCVCGTICDASTDVGYSPEKLAAPEWLVSEVQAIDNIHVFSLR